MGDIIVGRRRCGFPTGPSLDVHFHHDHKIPPNSDITKIVHRIPWSDNGLRDALDGSARTDGVDVNVSGLGNPQLVKFAIKVILLLLASLHRIDRLQEILVRIELVVRRRRF